MMKPVLFLLAFFSTLLADKNAPLYFSGNCVTCHRIDKSISAPSIIEVQQRYKAAFKDKKSFVEYMSKWVHKPNVEGSLMHDAIAKYELMPELAFDMQTLRSIAAYLYEHDFSKRD